MNIPDILDKHNIPYSSEGKNIAKGWIGLECPFCGDTRNHMGINLTTSMFSCFICGKKGTFKFLIHEFTGIWIDGKAEKSFIQHKEKIRAKEISYDFNEINETHKDYLRKRNYEPEDIIEKYQVKSGGFAGIYKYRIIIPYFFKNKLITFTSRDVTGLQEVKYKSLANELSIKTPKETLYGIDQCQETVIVVEGIFDSWRIGKGSVALSGKIASEEQIHLLKEFKRIFIMLDKDAEKEATELAHNIESSFNDVHLVTLDIKDPDCLNQKDVYDLRKEIFGKIY